MIPLLLFLLGCVAVYVRTVVAAFSALMRLSLRLKAERNGRRDALDGYLDDPVRLFVPARVFLGAIFAVATVLFAVEIGELGSGRLQSAWVLLLSIAAFVLVCEHLIPLVLARRSPERVLDVVLPTFDLVVRFLRPVTSPLIRLATTPRRERHEPSEGDPGPHAAAAAPGALEPDGVDAGAIEREERRLLRSIVDFGDTLVREVMTPRPDIVAVRADATLAEIRALFAEQEYSRLPVFSDNLDNIQGFVFVKDLVHLAGMTDEDRPIARLLRPAHVVPETKHVADLLKELQRQQAQSAIVVDEFGGTAGLVTVEDLLEEIVGEIRDEYDVESEPIVDEGNGTFVFSAKVDVDKVADRLGVDIERQGFETVGGYVLSHLGRVPTAGESFDIDGLSVEVLEAERRRVHRVRIRRRQEVRTDAVS